MPNTRWCRWCPPTDMLRNGPIPRRIAWVIPRVTAKAEKNATDERKRRSCRGSGPPRRTSCSAAADPSLPFPSREGSIAPQRLDRRRAARAAEDVEHQRFEGQPRLRVGGHRLRRGDEAVQDGHDPCWGQVLGPLLERAAIRGPERQLRRACGEAHSVANE